MPGETDRFIYMDSAAIKQRIAYDVSTDRVVCKDGTVYEPEEIQIMAGAGKTISLEVHLVKRIFQGVIVRGGKNNPRP
ncbi:MAG: hypothetical protein LBD29_04045 [Treponema sp.]|jgi:hypothetical protein|nr:hypothetical protein [Treponema sp.]